MSTTPNHPYAPPTANLELRQGTVDGITPAMLTALAGTKGWVRFLSLLLIVGAAVTALGMLPWILTVASGEGGGLSLFVTLGSLAMTVLYVIPGVFLFRFASGLKRAVQTPSAEAVAAALARQRVFWHIAVVFGFIMAFVGLVFLLPNVQRAVNSIAVG